mgnify:CR=1 FL=1
MKKIGLLGGMTTESSVEYYRLINEISRNRMGGIHSVESVMASVDFGNIYPLMEQERWDLILEKLISASLDIQRGGADFLVICTNTMHKLADQIAEKIDIPILNIIDVTAEAIKKKGLARIALLGTRFTMIQDFFRNRLAEKHQLAVMIPEPEEIGYIHRVIVDELSIGRISEDSKTRYWQIIDNLKKKDAEGIILGCTEIPLLIKQVDGDIPLFDTTTLHAEAAVDFALA